MQPDPPTANEKKPGGWRRFFKRVLWGLLTLLLLLAVFHRPLLRWGLNSAVPRFAKSAGYEIQWTASGSVVTGLNLRDVTIHGPATSPLRSITLREAKATYSLVELMRHGTGHFLESLEVSDATVEMDTRNTAPKPAKEPSEVWANRVKLHNVNVHVATAAGDINVKGLSLLLDKDRPGEIGIEELTLPGGMPTLAQVHGTTSVRDRTIILDETRVTQDVQVNRLELGMGELAQGAMPFVIKLHSGEGTLEAAGRMEGIGKRFVIDANLAIQKISDGDVRRWVHLPEKLAWRIEQGTLKFKGPPSAPQEIEAALVLDATGVQTGGVNADHLQTTADISGAQLRVPSLSMRTGANSAEISGSMALPPAWQDMKTLSADLQWRVDAPKLEEFFRADQAIAGSVRGTGTLALKDGKLAGAQGNLNGQALQFRQWRLSTVTADVTTDADLVRIKSLSARLDERNTLTAQGQIQLSGRQSAEFTWDAALGDVAAVARMAGLRDAETLRAESCVGQGTVRFDLAGLRAKEFTSIAAGGKVEITKLSWQNRALQRATVTFTQQGPRVELRTGELIFDEQNQASLTGSLLLEGRQPLDVAWQAELRDLRKVAGWLAWKPDLPQPEAGTLVSQGTATGAIADFREREFSRAKANATLHLQGFVAGKAQCEAANLDISCQDGRVELKPLEVRFDARNQLIASGHALLAKPGEFVLEADGALPEIAKLSAWSEMFRGPAITGGSATISWRGSGKLFQGEVMGNGTVRLNDVKLADRPAFSVSLTTKHEGRRAEISELLASTGNFRVSARASVSDTDLTVPELTVMSGDLRLVIGEAQVPLALAQRPRPKIPLDASRPMRVSLHAAKLEMVKLFAAFGQKAPVTGVMDADVELHGLLSHLEGTLFVALKDLRADAMKGKLEPAILQLDGTLARGRLSLKASADQKPLRTLTVTGEMPLDAEQVIREPSSIGNAEIDAHVVLPDSDLSIVRRFVPTIAELEGKVGADVRIRGPLRSPHWQGVLLAEAPRATFVKTPMDIRDLRARVSFRDKRITLDDVSAILAGGDIRVTGGVDVTELKIPKVDLRLVAQQALIVRNESMSARANGIFTCTGTLQKADIAGSAELVRCRVFKEIEFIPLSLPNQLPPPPPPVRPRTSPTLPAPFEQWTFNVDVVTRDSIRLLGNVMNGGATANLHLGGTGAKPELEGEVAFEGARVRLPNSKLTITRGKLIFTKDKPFEPMLDVQGDSLVGNYEVSVYAYGSAFQPKVRFTSSPPLSEGEIATLLATGSVGGGEQAAASTAANTAAFQVLSKAYRSVFDKAAPKRYDAEPPRLTFSFSPLSTGTSAPGVSANYEISDRLQASGTVTERGTFRGMLYYMVRLR